MEEQREENWTDWGDTILGDSSQWHEVSLRGGREPMAIEGNTLTFWQLPEVVRLEIIQNLFS